VSRARGAIRSATRSASSRRRWKSSRASAWAAPVSTASRCDTGANKRMLYYYFGSKENLFLAVLEDSYARIRNAEKALDLEHADPREALKRLIDFTWRYYLEHPEFMTLLNSENLHKGRHVRRSSRVREMHSPLVETLRGILRRGQKAGMFRANVDPVQLYISIAGEGYFYLSNRYTLSQIFDRDLMEKRALASRARHNADMILNALRRDG
jgi:AcrR family transcriptional regulator